VKRIVLRLCYEFRTSSSLGNILFFPVLTLICRNLPLPRFPLERIARWAKVERAKCVPIAKGKATFRLLLIFLPMMIPIQN
jgi:hypothetical protein